MTALLLIPLSAALAAAPDPAPEVVLARARTGRVAFVRAASDVDRFAARIPTKQRYFPYIEMLDELAAVGGRLDAAGLGIDPVKDLGADLTSNGMKWVRLDKDPPAFVRTFLKWSTNDTRASVAGDSELLLTAEETPERLLAWSEGTLNALEAMRDLKADRAATQAFEELQGVVARLILARGEDFTPEQLRLAIERTRSAPGLEEVLAFLDRETGLAADAARRRRVADWAILASENARRLGPGAPLHLASDAGGILLEALGRALAAGDRPDDASLDAALDALAPSQLSALLGQLVDLYGEQAVPREQADYLWSLTEKIAARFPELAASGRWRDFSRLSARLAALHFLGGKSLEGVYRLRAGGGDWTLTVAEAGGGLCALVLLPPDGRAGAALWYAAFRYRNGRFRAEPVPSSAGRPPAGGWPRLWIDLSGPANTAEGVLFDARGRPTRFQGERAESFPRLDAPGTSPDADALSGVYRGTAGDRDASLTLAPSGLRLAGQFAVGASTGAVALSEGDYDRRLGVVTLTAAELSDAGQWSQVRGIFSDGGHSFDGFALLGGPPVSVKLRKTEDF